MTSGSGRSHERLQYFNFGGSRDARANGLSKTGDEIVAVKNPRQCGELLMDAPRAT